ncbi:MULTISPECIES: hypothetical protein [Archaeoglobus]|jgi:hypothetical protein|nr:MULTISPECIES: hypothetical protein [Archaeoglobus]AIG99128.1 hypothetical protein AFULGI_00024110 [Archaeoglobus fulgidus DSM 8774]KUJ92982.1 MAG: hypothetical protein XD40_1853 [Archaeoglobus fulgidus]KUK06431.1 MAG: Uncharacterized protein XD48_1304 [Archaeoglobus fulgidus]MDI3498833.1 hypothetical protein [Archaeoglobus sp.]
MSVRGANRYGLSFEGIIQLLGGDDEARKAVALLRKHFRRGKIPKDELDVETALTLDYFRLALPVSSFHDSLSWKMRFFAIEDMEVPYIVRFFIEDVERGIGDWKATVERYFRAIGEERAEDFVKIFEEMVERSKNLIICGEDIVDISMKYGRDGGVVIAEMKGAGLISPTVGCGAFGRAKAPLYEINRFFAMLLEKQG